MKLIVGLGNPGTQYKGTRHNIGFEALDRFAGSLSWKDRGGAEVAETKVGDEKIVLVKPMTFMNRSGEPLQALIGFYKVNLEDVVVVFDEIDIPLGTLRIRKGGSAGGHRGVESVIQMCGGPDFTRVRIGVGRPVNPQHLIADWVLGKFSAEERIVADKSVDDAKQALEILIKDGMLRAQQAYSS
jgi:PTH1 family peptidyl-tRNA hydrolase